MAQQTTLLRYRGDYTSLTAATALIKPTAVAGDFAMINGKVYEWNASTSALEESTNTTHYKGTFTNIYKVQRCYPNGGVEGDYVIILGFAHYWQADRNTWVVNEKRDEYIDEVITTLTEQVGKVDTFSETITNLVNAGYMFGGIIDAATVAPTMNTTKVCFLALTEGTYKNFGDKTVDADEVALFKWDGKSWDKENTGLAKKSTLDALSKSFADYKTEVDNTITTFKGEVNDQISEFTNPLVATLGAPTGVVEANQSNYFVIRGTVARKDGTAVEDPDTFSIVYDGTEVLTSPDTVYKGRPTVGTHTTTMKVTKGKMSDEVTKTYIGVNASYLGFAAGAGAADITDITALGMKAVFAAPTGSFTMENTIDKAYLWIVIPDDQTLNSVKLAGYEVPMQLPIAKDGYRYYRSSYPLVGGSYTFVIS